MEAIRYENSEIDERIIRAVTEIGYEEMTPIQQSAIPALLEGRDIIGQAQTGTGKTAAFGIPLVQMIDPEDERVQAIVLCPTRELAIQAADELRRYAKYAGITRAFSELSRMIFASTFMPGRRLPVSSRVTVTG